MVAAPVVDSAINTASLPVIQPAVEAASDVALPVESTITLAAEAVVAPVVEDAVAPAVKPVIAPPLESSAALFSVSATVVGSPVRECLQLYSCATCI